MSARSFRYVRPMLAAYQLAALFGDFRFGLCEASTKSGKTHGCIVWLLEQALKATRPGRNYWWIAPSHAQAKIAYDRLKRAIPAATYRSNDTEKTLTLLNGAVIWFKSGELPDNLYGDDVYAAVIDEASRMREAAWNAVFSTLTATDGPVRIIGNVKGKHNWFYKLSRRAEAGTLSNSHYAKMTIDDAVAAGVVSQASRDEALEVYGGADDPVYRELYLAEPSEDGSNPFSLIAIENCVMPLSKLPAVCYGVDLAKENDYTVIVGLDKHGRTCHLERWNRRHLPPGFAAGTDYWDATEKRIRSVIGQKVCLVDSTGAGDPVFEKIAKGRRNCHPYVFSAQSKQRLMEGLAVAIQTGAIGFPEGWLKDELDTFEFEHRLRTIYYSAPEGLHDDGVMGLALATEASKIAPRVLTFH